MLTTIIMISIFISILFIIFFICSCLVTISKEDKLIEDEEQMRWLREYNKKYLK